MASSRFPIREPFAGGLEATTHALAERLSARGHDVTLFAGPGSDPALPVRLVVPAAFEVERGGPEPTSAPPGTRGSPSTTPTST